MNILYMDDFDLTLETEAYFLESHAHFTTIWTENQFTIYADPVLGALTVNESVKTIAIEGIYENYRVLQGNCMQALRSINTINEDLNMGCFYLGDDGSIVFRIKQGIYRQNTAKHDISLLIQIFVMTMKRYFSESLQDLCECI